MITFILSLVLLVVGYLVYGKFVDNFFGTNKDNPTPAITMEDGVDYVPMKWSKIFLIQFLNIAGLGPIFGAISGALWGPAAFLWIVFGCIFAGAVHDYFTGVLSIRNNGASVSEIVGKYLGEIPRKIMVVFSVVLLVLVGVVFITGPAGLLHTLTNIDVRLLVGIIIIYYLLATLLPIDKLIGKIYPIFGASLIIMAIGISFGLIIKGYNIPEVQFTNLHPDSTPIFPFLFITIACGAISGFHATQSPMMARCVTNEKESRKVFYGAMITEGILALIWAAAAMSFFGGTEKLNEVLASGGPAVVVNEISNTLLGKAGGILAILGVVACPITSGDTAFRSARLVIADAFKIEQKGIKNRFLIAIPLFVIGYYLTGRNFSMIWRYFTWSNQTLAMIMLWAASAYLVSVKKRHYITTIPAVFMTAVTSAYILQAPEGFKLNANFSNIAGVIFAAILLLIFYMKTKNVYKDINPDLKNTL